MVLENVAERKKRIAYFYPQRSTNFVAFDEDNDAIGTQMNQIYTTYIIQIKHLIYSNSSKIDIYFD